MSLQFYPWVNLNTEDFSNLTNIHTVVIFPVSAVEQHGPHLPLGVDYFILEGILKYCADLCLDYLESGIEGNILVLPNQAIGSSIEHQNFDGTLSYDINLFMKLLSETCQWVAKTGLKKLLIVNSHGGNQAIIELIARQVRIDYQMDIFVTSWYNWDLGKVTHYTPEQLRKDVHAGYIETSLMLYLHPKLVKMAKAQNFLPTNWVQDMEYKHLRASAKKGWMVEDYNNLGAIGNAIQGSSEMGFLILDHLARYLLNLIYEFLKFKEN